MTRTGYLVAVVLISIVYTFGAASARRVGGARALWLTAVGAAVFLAAIGVFDWSRLPVKETPLHTYLLLAVVPTLATTIVLHALASRQAPLSLQVVAGVVVWLGVGFATLLTGFYP
jgi:hypothetical protein